MDLSDGADGPRVAAVYPFATRPTPDAPQGVGSLSDRSEIVMTALAHPLSAASWDRLRTLCGERGLDLDVVAAAVAFADRAHDGQLRRSGEPYVTHALEVAALVVDVGASTAMVAAALLHDTVEDAGVTLTEIAETFGEDVASMVEGCAKVAAVHPSAADAFAEADRLRRLFVALAADPRVVVVKLCDRLHNLRTIDALEPVKAARIGRETLAVHAPLAHRLGLGAIKAELEDRAFAVADPVGYDEVGRAIDELGGVHEWLEDARNRLGTHLDAAGVAGEVSGRVKHRWSVHRKAARLGVEPGALHDLLGLRVVVPDVAACYVALAEVHRLWTPVEGRLKDYIDRPKLNAYQSLHTTVVGPAGRLLEVQIRTADMHAIAEHGAAAHHAYKHPGSEPRWVGRLLDLDADDAGPSDDDAGRSDEVFVLSPKGDVITLPLGACVVDVAYAIHTEVGHRCVGAKLDGRLVPLHTRVTEGQRVEIVTGARNGPAPEWSNWVVTSKARTRIRQFHARRAKERARTEGRERLTKALRDVGLRLDDPATVAALVAAAGLGSIEDVAEAVAGGRILPSLLLRRLAPEAEVEPEPAEGPELPPRRGDEPSVAAVAGLPGVDVRLAGCCTPVPPVPLRGFVSAGGVVAHRADCAAANDPARTAGRSLAVHWIRADRSILRLTLLATPHPGLFAAIAAQAASAGADLLAVQRRPGRADAGAGATTDVEVEVDVAVRPERRGAVRAALALVEGVRSLR